MPTRTLTLACALVAALVLPAAAVAKLPSPASNLIEPAKSIGGVKLGQGTKKAKQAWGKGAECTLDGSGRNGACGYAGSQKQGSASFGVVDGKVVDAFLNAGSDSKGKAVYRTPLASFKTTKGIGLGATFKQVKQAYPKAKDISGVLLLKGKGKSYTTFAFEDKRLNLISIGDGKHQG
jgi:hypothetical protein